MTAVLEVIEHFQTLVEDSVGLGFVDEDYELVGQKLHYITP